MLHYFCLIIELLQQDTLSLCWQSTQNNLHQFRNCPVDWSHFPLWESNANQQGYSLWLLCIWLCTVEWTDMNICLWILFTRQCFASGVDTLLGSMQTPMECVVIVLCVCVPGCGMCLFGWWLSSVRLQCALHACPVESQECVVCVCVEQKALMNVCESACSPSAAACLTFLSMSLWKGVTYYSRTRTHAEQSPTSPSSMQCPLPCPFMPISASLPAYAHYSRAVHLQWAQQFGCPS